MIMPPHFVNQILTGDARVLADQIPDDSIDLVLTDPPYGLDFKYNGYKDDPHAYPELLHWVIQTSMRVVRPGGLCFVFVAQPRLRHVLPLFPEDSRIFAACKNFVQYRPTAVQFGYDPVIFWQKDGPALLKPYAGKRDWHVGNTARWVLEPTFHECRRPLDTIEYMLAHFCPPGGIVCDYFMGSGTTAIAARRSACSFIGFEIRPEIADQARARIEMTQAIAPVFLEEQQRLRLEEAA